jgi:hypothetical protein
MRRFFFVVLLSVLAGGVVGRPLVAQTPPDFISHYKVVPQVSTLEQMGGISAVAPLRYRVSGNYDFDRLGMPLGAAEFANSDLTGTLVPSPPTPVTVDVDKIFNMDGLTGKRLPVASLLNVYQFKGTNADGEAVNMYAALLGPWMYLRGATQPPTASAGLFTYQLRALARTGPFPDLNGDGVVDALDYVLLRKFGSATAADIAAGASLVDWHSDFGNALPDITSLDIQLNTALGTTMGTAGVPEPGPVALVAIGILIIASRKRGRALG